MDAPVRGTRSMIGLDRLHEKMFVVEARRRQQERRKEESRKKFGKFGAKIFIRDNF